MKLHRHLCLKALLREHRQRRVSTRQLRGILRSLQAGSMHIRSHQLTEGSWRLALIFSAWRLSDESPLIFTFGVLSLVPALLITMYTLVSRVARFAGFGAGI